MASTVAAAALFAPPHRPIRASRQTLVRASSQSVNGAAETIRLTLRKPLGLVLVERPGPPPSVFIEEVTPGGNADKDGRLKPGDLLTKCSAVLLKAGKEGEYEREGYGQRPFDNWERVMFDARGKQFDTVMAAIGSNSERWGIFDVTLEFERSSGAAAAVRHTEE